MLRSALCPFSGSQVNTGWDGLQTQGVMACHNRVWLLRRLSFSALTSGGTSESAYPSGDVTPYAGMFAESFVREPSMGSDLSVADVTPSDRHASRPQADTEVAPGLAAASSGPPTDGTPQVELSRK